MSILRLSAEQKLPEFGGCTTEFLSLILFEILSGKPLPDFLDPLIKHWLQLFVQFDALLEIPLRFSLLALHQPNYAPAYSGLADCYITLGSIIASSRPRGVMPEAKYAAERALALDETLAEAHASLGFVLLWYEWDFARAKREFERAIELDSKYATAHLWYAHYLTIFGHHEEAIRETRLACELDPTSAANTNIFGMLLYHARQYDQAIEQAEKIRELDPNFRPPLYRRCAYEQLSRYAEAVEYDLQIKANAGEKQERLDKLRAAFQTRGIRGFWKEEVEQFTEDARREYEPIRHFAYLYSLLGEKDKAFAYLEKMYEERDGFLIYLQSDPRYDSLRSDPRFAKLEQRVGLAP